MVRDIDASLTVGVRYVGGGVETSDGGDHVGIKIWVSVGMLVGVGGGSSVGDHVGTNVSDDTAADLYTRVPEVASARLNRRCLFPIFEITDDSTPEVM